MGELTFKWHTHIDERTCEVCRPLDGFTWTYSTKRQMPRSLWHPVYGVVYDLQSNKPTTHGEYTRKGPWNCRCYVSVEWVLSDLEHHVFELEKNFIRDFSDPVNEWVYVSRKGFLGDLSASRRSYVSTTVQTDLYGKIVDMNRETELLEGEVRRVGSMISSRIPVVREALYIVRQLDMLLKTNPILVLLLNAVAVGVVTWQEFKSYFERIEERREETQRLIDRMQH